MWRQYLIIATGILLSMIGLSLSTLLSFGVAQNALFWWQMGLPRMDIHWNAEQVRLGLISFLGLMLGGTGAYMAWLGIRDIRACRSFTASRV
ncbi:MAG: hypothetical protein JNG89_02380 [Planctomycetaceae bacterium]|nr:hypothetical protein [Planctomycetaceae bacterium]